VSESNQFFLLGAAKAGTTSLHEALDLHSEICMSRPKEPVFFEKDEAFEKGVEYYREEYYDHSGSPEWYGDARQRNLYLPWVPQRIAEQFPAARLLVSLRDPVKRALSHYWHARRHGREQRNPEEAFVAEFERIEAGRIMETEQERAEYQRTIINNRGLYPTYVDSGHYGEQLQRYRHYFNDERIHVVVFERLVDQPEHVLSGIIDFLGLEWETTVQLPSSNRGRIPRWDGLQRLYYWLGATAPSDWIPEAWKDWLRSWNESDEDYGSVSPELIQRLRSYYRPRNEQLCDRLDWDSIPEWEEDADGTD